MRSGNIKTDLAHGVHGFFSEFVTKVFAFLQTNAMFTSDSAIHSNGALTHAVDQVCSDLFLSVVVK